MVYATMDLPQDEGPFPDGITPNGPNCWVQRRLFDLGWRYNSEIGPKGAGRVSGSEWEFFLRLRAAGFEPVYVPTASIIHRVQPHQTTISYLLRRGFASGRGTVRIFGIPEGCPKWFGAPRYLYRMLAADTARAVARISVFQPKRALEHLMRVANHLGAIREAKALATCPQAGQAATDLRPTAVDPNTPLCRIS
jgi:hypothetical protein